MATVIKSVKNEFVMSPVADNALTAVSGDFAAFVLEIASDHAAQSRRDGTRLVTSDDIKNALATICDAVEGAFSVGTVPSSTTNAVRHLRAVCNEIPSEPRAK